MNLRHKYIITIVPLLLLANTVLATKALTKLQKFVNPDGTTVTIKVMGDHLFGYKQTLSGRMVEIGSDGYLYYANLTTSGKELTQERAGASPTGNSGIIPYSTIQAIREHNKKLQPSLPHPVTMHKGTKSTVEEVTYPVLLVEFEDVKFTVENPKTSFNNLLNASSYSHNGATGSVSEYLNANFRGYRKFSFALSDVITIPAPIASYGAQQGARNDSNPAKLIADACAIAAQQGFDIASFDHDNNGVIDNVAIIFAGHSEAEGGHPNSLWPHQMNISGNPIQTNGIKINSYSCSAELRGAQGGEISPIGTFCHEFLHSLGLPDLYDTNGEEEGLSPALYGSLSIMDAGNFLNNGNTPPYLCAIEREILGIARTDKLNPDSTYALAPIHSSERIYKVSSAKQGEYFLFEYREAAGWDRHIGGSGMVVYHVDMSGSIYGGLKSSERWKYNNVNALASHECAKVLPAMGYGCGIEGVFFPGGANIDKLISFEGNTLLKDWNGNAVGIGLRNIQIGGGKITFSTVKDYSYNSELPAATECKVTPMQKDAWIEWESEGKGALWMIEWKKESDEHFNTIISDTTGYCIRGLEPGCLYDVAVRYFNLREYGQPAIIQFATRAVTSPYPYIFIKGDTRKKKHKIELRVFNLPEDATSVTWFLNGEKLASDSFFPPQDKDLEIEVEIRYTDASNERIYKKIEQ